MENLPPLPHSSQEIILLNPLPPRFPHSRVQILSRPLCIHTLFQAHTGWQVDRLLLKRDFDNVLCGVAAGGEGSCSFGGETALLFRLGCEKRRLVYGNKRGAMSGPNGEEGA